MGVDFTPLIQQIKHGVKAQLAAHINDKPCKGIRLLDTILTNMKYWEKISQKMGLSTKSCHGQQKKKDNSNNLSKLTFQEQLHSKLLSRA